MSHQSLAIDVNNTIVLWRKCGIAAPQAWCILGANQTTIIGRPRWRDVRTFMLGWLAAREQLSLQRVG